MYRLRFDLRAPGHSAEETAQLYRTAVDMAAWADQNGCTAIALSEHHASEDGYLPAPLTLAAAMAAVTENTVIMIAAALLPLYDPVRLAEEMIVLDHLSRGRIAYTFALGYRPVEYELYGEDWANRGKVADEKLTVLLRHLQAESPDASGPLVTPRPFNAGGPFVTWGGQTKAAARRAGRNGIGFLAQTDDPALEVAYREAALAAGHEPGFCMLPPQDIPSSVFVNDDVDAGWKDVGDALLVDAVSYWAWNSEAGHEGTTASLSSASTVEELRAANGSHRVVTVEEAVQLIGQYGPLGLQPLCGGLDPEVAWTYLRRVVEQVVPAATPS
jgi:alkanesulfonate monooxygenase SsuD/methylene tetrahydromethanopterin reductase-like flavin-dependent oxidoreductase (luciferase family)